MTSKQIHMSYHISCPSLRTTYGDITVIVSDFDINKARRTIEDVVEKSMNEKCGIVILNIIPLDSIN